MPRLDIKAARAGDGRTLHVTWADGIEHRIDVASVLARFEVFRPLDDDETFRRVTVDPFGGDLRWAGPDGDDSMAIDARTLWRLALEQDGQRLRDWRKGHAMTQEAAAAALGLSLRTIKGYESGEYPIPKTVKLALVGHDALSCKAA